MDGTGGMGDGIFGVLICVINRFGIVAGLRCDIRAVYILWNKTV